MSPRTFLIALAFLAFVSLGLPDGLLGVAWPSIRDTFGLPLDALGALLVSGTAGYLTSSFLAGRILRFIGVGTLLALSTAAAATALLGYALTPVWPLMVVLAFLAGLGGGAVDAGLNAYGAAHFSGRTLNWLHAFFGVGTTLGPLIVAGVLNAGLVWRWGYAIVGCAQLLLAATFALTRKRWETSGSVQAPPPASPARTRETLRRGATWLGMAVFFVYTGVEMVAGQWSYSVLTLARGVSEGAAGVAVSLYWGSLMVGRVLFGFVADRVPLVPTLRACMLGAAVGGLLFWLNLGLAASLAGLMLVGLSVAPIFASLVAMTPARIGRAHADSAIGFQIAAAGLGGAALPGLVGLIAGRAGLEVVGAALVVAATLLLALFEVMTWDTRRRLGGVARSE
ncbi:MFS transporter [Truepera radiovictrix]|uniref:Major facilitator superfamily MFS_1 n=1 Tax=Truepera radiovictrix (strain DSM 17093 / CIP 108686 / LMG 22925 / RQ-24) TaxID=649638 RepID=D7CUK6_TRURR|nr:MFS transporter [Truepera radiovictrix]ADI15791.1 major facilitator superfamily MFS_1 [Truepera radiovictrix DSM 17093]WMT58581.1 MFS transporter [Truepera radiovictrix]